MTSKKFNKKAQEICKKFNCKILKNDLENSYEINTIFGKLYLRYDPSPRIKVYSVFMRFTESKKFDLKKFHSFFSKHENINTFSFKWNLHNSNPEYILDELEERLDNLHWLENPKNQNLVINNS